MEKLWDLTHLNWGKHAKIQYMEDQWENSWRMIYQYVFFYIYVNLLADVTIFEGKSVGILSLSRVMFPT